ncbi:MAG: hypothetical protein HWE35_15635 [Rhodobacteraceae bacterium]|nr:hypothetical protein [Paracoccaceae bacterium]
MFDDLRGCRRDLGAFKSKGEREKLFAEFREQPFEAIFVTAWLASVCIFVAGIFLPVFGEGEFFNTGLAIWQAGGLAALVGWVISWFVKLY